MVPASPRQVVLAGQTWALDAHLEPDGLCHGARAVGDDGRVARAKLLRPAASATPSRAESFASLVPRLCALRADGVVSVLAGGVCGGWFCVLTDAFEGDTLDVWLAARGPLPPGQAQWLFDALCAGVHAAHRVGLVHRRACPQTVKIRAAPDGRHAAAWVDAELAVVLAGEVELPAGFIAPEQRETVGNEGPRSDVFSLAAMYLALRSGSLTPEGAEPWTSWVEAHGGSLRARLGAIYPTIPSLVLDVLSIALHPQARERPENAQQLRTLLRRALQGSNAWLASPEAVETVARAPSPPAPAPQSAPPSAAPAPPVAFVSSPPVVPTPAPPAAFTSFRSHTLSVIDAEAFYAAALPMPDSNATMVSSAPRASFAAPTPRVAAQVTTLVDEEPTPQMAPLPQPESDTVLNLAGASARARRATFAVESEGLGPSHPPYAESVSHTQPQTFSPDSATLAETVVARPHPVSLAPAAPPTAVSTPPLQGSRAPLERAQPAGPPQQHRSSTPAPPRVSDGVIIALAVAMAALLGVFVAVLMRR